MKDAQLIDRFRWREELADCWGKVKVFVIATKTNEPDTFRNDKLTLLGFWYVSLYNPNDNGYFIFAPHYEARSINDNLDTPIRTFDAAAVFIDLWWQNQETD